MPRFYSSLLLIYIYIFPLTLPRKLSPLFSRCPSPPPLSSRALILTTSYVMETSTLVFLAAIIGGFVILRWLILPIPDQIEEAAHAARNQNLNRTEAPRTSRERRPVTDSMIDVVQAIAPQLTRGQIRMDLERTGLVEATIDRFMEDGTLPIPSGETHEADHSKKPVSTKPANLIERYGLQSKIDGDSEVLEDTTSVSGRRDDMILKARKRLAAQLGNEIENPAF